MKGGRHAHHRLGVSRRDWIGDHLLMLASIGVVIMGLLPVVVPIFV